MFKLEGEIESPKESEYLRDLVQEERKRFRRILSVLLLLTLVVSGLFVWMLLKNQKLTSDLEKAQIISLQMDSLKRSLKNQQDSILLLNEKNIGLQYNNDLLAENSINPKGVFFDVVIGNFENFNLSRYLSELADARHEVYDGGDKLVIGRFRSFKKALLFENDLKRMGLKNVELVGFVDGKIVTYQEALKTMQLRK